MTKNVKLIYELIQKDLKAQGWDDEAIAEAIAESQRERQVTGADEKNICVKEMSYLSEESLQIVTKQLNRKSMTERIKPIGSKIGSGFKVLMPYMSLIAVILCSLNLIYIAKVDKDIARVETDIAGVRDEIYEVSRAVNNISMDYDNSDVIRAIEDAEGNIISYVEDAESNIRRNIILWSD